jgi:hypothetical protein
MAWKSFKVQALGMSNHHSKQQTNFKWKWVYEHFSLLQLQRGIIYPCNCIIERALGVENIYRM